MLDAWRVSLARPPRNDELWRLRTTGFTSDVRLPCRYASRGMAASHIILYGFETDVDDAKRRPEMRPRGDYRLRRILRPLHENTSASVTPSLV